MNSIKLENVCKSFGETVALENASVEANPGEIHAIIGENGSGKSTLAKIMSGIVLADSGDVNVLGVTPYSPLQAMTAGVMTVHQEVLTADSLTVYENIFPNFEGVFKNSLTTIEKIEKSFELLSKLADKNISPLQPVKNLSLSDKQWIVIARALVKKPKALIFDESSAALDLNGTERLHSEMINLKNSGSCVILVTHRISELVKITDSATVLRDGKSVDRLEKKQINEDRILNLMSDPTLRKQKSSKLGKTKFVDKPSISFENCKISANSSEFHFDARRGQVIGIVGLEGAGQEKFITALAGINMLYAGKMRYRLSEGGEFIINSLKKATDLGIVYVSGDRKREGIFPNLSILENFSLGLADTFNKFGILKSDSTLKILENERDRLRIKWQTPINPITTLSGGNQQKVLIARAFASNPSAIVLNDPARGVDIATKQVLYKNLRSFADRGGVVIYLSSEIEEFYHFTDRVDIFFNQTIYASLTADECDESKLLSSMFGLNGAQPHSNQGLPL